MKITPITPILHTPQDKPREDINIHTSARRYGAIAQLLFDALTPIVDAYEAGAKTEGDTCIIYTSKATLERAQEVLRGIASDIYA